MANNGSVPITIVGNLTDDPELRFTPSGNACAKFTVALNRKNFNTETKKWEDAGSDFHRVTAWRLLAENIVESLKKGDRVIVQGMLKSSTFEDNEGNKRTYWEVTADAVGPDLMFAQVTEVRKIEYRKQEKETPARSTRARK